MKLGTILHSSDIHFDSNTALMILIATSKYLHVIKLVMILTFEHPNM